MVSVIGGEPAEMGVRCAGAVSLEPVPPPRPLPGGILAEEMGLGASHNPSRRLGRPDAH